MEGSPRVRPLQSERDDNDDVDTAGPTRDDDDDDEPPHRLPSRRIIATGVIVSSLFALVAIWRLFGRQGIEPYTTFVNPAQTQYSLASMKAADNHVTAAMSATPSSSSNSPTAASSLA